MILSIKTDNPVAEIGLFNDDGGQLDYYTWQADRRLARELLQKINDRLQTQNATWQDIAGVIAFRGPGSFTGLRIGITVANTTAYARNAPIVGALGDDWVKTALADLTAGKNDRIVLPHYGSEPHITLPKK